MMKYYLAFIKQSRYILVGLAVVLLAISTISISKLTFDGSYRIWFGNDSTLLKHYDGFCAEFGNDDSILIVFEDPNGIFNPKALSSIQSISSKLEKIPSIARVDSLLNYQYIYPSPDETEDIIVENFLPIDKLKDKIFLSSRREIAMNDPMVQELLINREGTTTMISARLSSFARMDKNANIELVQQIQTLLEQEGAQNGYTFYISGSPINDAALASIAEHDIMIYAPLAFLIIIAILYLFFKSYLGIFIPIITVIVASLVTLTFYALMGFKLNNFSINIPIFITAIGIADAVHFYIAWVSIRHMGFSNTEAIEKTIRKNLLPMILTTLTTSLGFGSLMTSDIVPLSTLGMTIAVGSITALLITLFIMPMVLMVLKEDYMPRPLKTARCLVREYNYARFVTKHDKKIAAGALLIAGILSLGITQTKIDSNSIKYFDTDTDVSKAAYFTMQNITGPASYEVLIDSHSPNGIKDPIFLDKVAKFDDALKATFPEVRHTSSLLDILKRFDKIMAPESNHSRSGGENTEVNAQYLLVYSLSLPQGMEINDKMDIQEQKLRFTIQADIANSSRSLEIIRWSEEWWRLNGLSAEVQGQVPLFARMQHMVLQTLTQSLLLTFGTIGILIFFIIRDLKLMVIFLIPNLLPLMMTLGFLGWAGIPIDIGISVAIVVVLGLAVDDTIYFFDKYLSAKKIGLGPEQTFDWVLEHSGSAMVFTTIILSSAFSVFFLSDFTPNVHFAAITISTMFLALFADLLLTPALISITDNFQKRNVLIKEGQEESIPLKQ
jgi:predicted RND superfamily exporter protein